jgi:hypothetical protein
LPPCFSKSAQTAPAQALAGAQHEHNPILTVFFPALLCIVPCAVFALCSNWDGMYVLFTYAAKRQTARSVQLLLSNPEAGSEDKILRHITFCRM